MSSIPSNLVRVTNMMSSRLSLANINRTNVDILKLSEQLSTGRSILRTSDDIIKAATIGALDDRIDRSGQLLSNLRHAATSLETLDSSLSTISEIAEYARGIASNQINSDATATDRQVQGTVIEQEIQGLLRVVNGQSASGYAFGGSTPSRLPVVAFGAGYRYVGTGNGLTTDLGSTSGVPITLGPTVVSGISSRIRGSVDLNPALLPQTPLGQLGGARGLGVSLGTIAISVDGGTPLEVDLRGAASVQDVIGRVQNTLTQYETDTGSTVLGSGGVSVQAGTFYIDVASGTPAHSIQFSDVAGGSAAQDLGLTATTPFAFSATNSNGLDLSPRLTLQSPISSLQGVSGVLGPIRISNAGRSVVVDLSTAQSVSDIKRLVESAEVGVRVQINSAGTGIDIVNEVSAGSGAALSISEVSGGNSTATRLGVRTFAADTRATDLNFGRGVKIVDDVINPITHTYDRALSSDFKIVLGDASRTTITVDLRASDMTDVQSIINRINAEAGQALTDAGLDATDFVARLGDDANGIVFEQAAGYAKLEVSGLNNSKAAENLGLLSGTWDSASATLTGQDRGKVRVDDMFTRLIDLRDALRADDTSGITLAGEDLEKTISSLIETRGVVGAYAKRVEDSTTHEQDRTLMDEVTRDDLRGVDFAAASSRFTLLQTQLQAGLQVTAIANSRTLLDFLG